MSKTILNAAVGEGQIFDPPPTIFSVPSDDLALWLNRAPSGSTIEYHRGFLAMDVSPPITRLASSALLDAIEIVTMVRKAQKSGAVYLAQKRLGPGHFSYRAVKASVQSVQQMPKRQPKPRPFPLSRRHIQKGGLTTTQLINYRTNKAGSECLAAN